MGDLSLESLAKIDHIFVTHSHLDHVTSIPFLVDTVCWMRGSPIVVYGDQGDARHPARAPLQLEDLAGLHPDPRCARSPFMVYREIEVGETVELGGRRFTPIPANHTVPAVGYPVENARAAASSSAATPR